MISEELMVRSLCLLWLAGMATRVTVLAVPPVLPLIRAELGMSETQVGLLIGLPLATWALAAVPGSLFIAKWGALRTLLLGLLLTAIAGAARAGTANLWLLYLVTLVMGFGIAIMQPANARLLRDWFPHKLGLGAAVSSNGILVGVALAPMLTIPVIMPTVGQSWRLSLLCWSLPVLITAMLFIAFAPAAAGAAADTRSAHSRWWPDWKNPLVWLLGITFGSNNAMFYGTNAFVPDYLASLGRAELIGPVLGCMNGSQVVTSALLLLIAGRLQGRVWPFVVFGIAPLLGIVGILVSTSAAALVLSGIVIGASLAVSFVITMVLALLLSPSDDVHRISAGMFTVSYSMALVLPVLCGALWDLTGLPWAAFVPVALCALTLTSIGAALTRSSAGRYRFRS
jgi:CP family cyanate transporter-like MFS transporter